jgi:hypothetical protein
VHKNSEVVPNAVEQSIPENEQNLTQNEQNLTQNEQNLTSSEQNLTQNEQNLTSRKVCTECGKIFATASSRKRHELKSCNGVSNSLICHYCHKTFKSYMQKHRHILKCDGSISSQQIVEAEPIPITTTMRIPYQHSNSINTQNVNSHIQTQNNVNNNQHIHITINTFGNESKDHIPKTFVQECFNNGGLGVGDMLNKIYFDDEHPENHNVRLTSLKNALVEVFRDKSWFPQSLYEIIETMISRAASHILGNVDLQTSNETLQNMNAIQNIQPKLKKRIRERTKSQLVARRQVATS